MRLLNRSDTAAVYAGGAGFLRRAACTPCEVDHFREDFFVGFAARADELPFAAVGFFPRDVSEVFFTTLPIPRPMRE